MAIVKGILELLSSQEKILAFISAEFIKIQESLGDDRKTKIIKGALGEVSDEDLVAEEKVVVTISEKGYIKRLKKDNYTVQNRGGKGKIGLTLKEEDAALHLLSCSTHDTIMMFTTKGRVFEVKAYDIPEFNRQAKGQPLVNLINIEQNEFVSALLTHKKGKFVDSTLDEDEVQEGEEESEDNGENYKYLFMATKFGNVKKTEIAEYEEIRGNGKIAIKLEDKDELIFVKPTKGNDLIMLNTKKAKSILFKEVDVRATGRNSMGVTGIRFKSDDDQVIAMDVVRIKENKLLTISEFGYGKTTELNEWEHQNRGGSGVFCYKISDKTGNLKVARIMDHPDKELLIMSEKGQNIRIKCTELPEHGRTTSGVRLIRLEDGDKVAAVAYV
jgi:DNA gyrase subunit A